MSLSTYMGFKPEPALKKEIMLAIGKQEKKLKRKVSNSEFFAEASKLLIKEWK